MKPTKEPKHKAETKVPKKKAKSHARVQDKPGKAALAPIGMTDPAREIMAKLSATYTAEALIDELDALTSATIDYTNKKGETYSRPDYVTRLRSLELRFAYLIGRPVERQEIIKHSPPASIETLMADAKRSPVFRATLIDLLQNLTKDEEGTKIKGE